MTGDYGQVAKHIETNAEGVIASASSTKFFGVFPWETPKNLVDTENGATKKSSPHDDASSIRD